MKLRGKLKRIIPKLRRFRGLVWISTILVWIPALILHIFFNNSTLMYLGYGLLIFYFAFSLAIAETRESRIWNLLWLILAILLPLW